MIRRGGGGVERGGDPCGRPRGVAAEHHRQAWLAEGTRATTRVPTPHPHLSRPYATLDGVPKNLLLREGQGWCG